jgi:ureidoglycolate hydrolase
MFERHAYTTQAFIPMARGEWGAGVGEPAIARIEGEGGMLVIVALNGPGQSSLFRPRVRLPFPTVTVTDCRHRTATQTTGQI